MSARAAKGLWATLAVVAIALLSSCSTNHARHEATPSSEQASLHNAADLAFVHNMIPHHQQGVELADLVPSRTSNADLRVIAAHIGADQYAEIKTLNLLLTQWNQPSESYHDHEMDHGQMDMPGMVDQATVDELETLRGSEFDTLWSVSMIAHHQGAVAMAEEEVAKGQSEDAIRLAQLIIEAQQREIAIMTHLISVDQ